MSSQDLPFGKTFVAGGIAGAAEVLAFYPLDTLKTRAQLNTSANSNMLKGMLTMLRAEASNCMSQRSRSTH